jgi:hypothetical protein
MTHPSFNAEQLLNDAARRPRGSENGSWPQPDMRLIKDDRLPVPAFDWEALPPAYKDLIKHMADDCGAPPDYIAAALIGTASAVLGNVRRVSPWEGWVEQPHLWFALAELAQSEFELASRFVAAPESNQRVGWLGRADLGV